MSTVTRPRGPLPRRVYWVRRLAVLGTALLLVVGVVRLFGGGDDSTAGEQARQAAANTRPSPTTTPKGAKGKKGKKKQQPVATPLGPTQGPVIPPPPVLAEPTGPCVPSDITLAPGVPAPIGGAPIGILLTATTTQSPACTWDVSAKSLVVKIRSGPDDIWTSRQCRRSITPQTVVLRNNAPAELTVTWSGRRSDDACSRLTQWALPGWYHVASAAYGGEPADVQFELLAPQAPVVTETVTPTPTPTHKPKKKKQSDLR